GARVALVDMKPAALSPAHRTPMLCELVCSNSLRSDEPTAPAGLLKEELRRAGSLVIACADAHRVPAADALAGERFGFGREVAPHAFEEPKYFEGCLPVEVMADRGDEVLAFGPMRPVGLTDPRTGRRAHAVVQLRAENRYGTSYNMVGFQTRLAYPEQKRIF